jgi:hypothetical protein
MHVERRESKILPPCGIAVIDIEPNIFLRSLLAEGAEVAGWLFDGESSLEEVKGLEIANVGFWPGVA